MNYVTHGYDMEKFILRAWKNRKWEGHPRENERHRDSKRETKKQEKRGGTKERGRWVCPLMYSWAGAR